MPHFTLQISPQQGPLLTALISISAERSNALKTNNIPIPQPITIRALIDTGAGSTCVDSSVLKSLNLTPTGSVSIITPSTGNQPVNADQYDVGLIIPGASSDHIPLFLLTLPVVCADLLEAQGFHALIGRDVLEHCVLTYNGSTKVFILAY